MKNDQERIAGLRRRVRKDGTVAWYWIAEAASRKAKGYKPSAVRLHGDMETVHARCEVMNAHLKEWLASKGRGQAPVYDGTIKSLIAVFKLTPESPYHQLKFNSRHMYDVNLAILDRNKGPVHLDSITGLDLRRWYNSLKEPQEPGGPERLRKAFNVMTLLRIVMKFGIVADIEECIRVNTVMEQMRFSAPPARTARITFDQVKAFCARAIESDRVSMAQAQALQFELTLRQADVIGQWEPVDGDATGILDRGHRWTGGVSWSHIDAAGVLTKETTKQIVKKDQPHVAQHDTMAYPFLRSMLDITPPGRRIGPIIINEETGLPYRDRQFQRLWRQIANEVGIPANIWNRDSRAGGVTEGSDAGADIEHLRHHATHSNIATTGRYNRNTVEKTRTVAKLRVAHRRAS